MTHSSVERSHTCMYRLFCPTEVAFHFAAPVESTSAPLDHRHLLSPVAAPATHQVAPFNPYRRIIALTSVGTRYPQTRGALAETWRRFIVDEVFGPRWFVFWVKRLQLEAVAIPLATTSSTLASQTTRVADHHSGSAVKSVLEVVANHSETGQSHPASLHRAGPGHPMALALLTHLRGHVLQHTKTTTHASVLYYCWWWWLCLCWWWWWWWWW
jgi:hypothetical protein